MGNMGNMGNDLARRLPACGAARGGSRGRCSRGLEGARNTT